MMQSKGKTFYLRARAEGVNLRVATGLLSTTPSEKLDKEFRFVPHLELEMDIEGFILVGGASSRMGRDKARLSLQGRPFVERIREALNGVAQRVRTVGAKESETLSALENIPDVHQAWGALGGLHAALTACHAEWAAVAACDLPFVTSELFVRLKEFRAGSQAVIPVQPDGRLQPLCALYQTKACKGVAEELIAAGLRRPLDLIESVRATRVPWKELADLEQAELLFMNVNTPEDFKRARRCFVEDSG